MENKRPKYSPCTVQRLEEEVVTNLLSLSSSRYQAPVAFQGATDTTSSQTLTSFTMPPSHVAFMQRMGYNRPWFDCFRPVSFSCVCYKCITSTDIEIPYLHGVMEQALLEGSPDAPFVTSGNDINIGPEDITEYDYVSGVRYIPVVRPILSIAEENFDIGTARVLDGLINVAHFYANDVVTPFWSNVVEQPCTPAFTRVLYRGVTNIETMVSQRVLATKITPTKLF